MVKAYLKGYMEKFKSGAGHEVIMVTRARIFSEPGVMFDCGRMLVDIFWMEGETFEDAYRKMREAEERGDPVFDFLKNVREW